MQDPDPNFQPVPGVSEDLRHGLRRIVAPNPSPMTFRGTNTYLLGTKELAVIDPGPNSAAHLAAILSAQSVGQRITHILVTHAHIDHSPLARQLSQETGAPVYAFGPAEAGRSDQMRHLAAQGVVSGGEGVDWDFAPDIAVADGTQLTAEDWQIEVIYTPGHMSNHISFCWKDAVFSGDHVMGWATSMVSPPDGDLTAFMASLRRLKTRQDKMYFPGHGAPILDPISRVGDLIAHRRGREAQILEALTSGAANVNDLTRIIYSEIDPRLHAAASRNVLAHLLDLEHRSVVIRPKGKATEVEFSLF